MDICLCGAESGYPHDYTCPYPLYRATAAQEARWLMGRTILRRKLVEELEPKVAAAMGIPGDGREISRAAEFRRVWEQLSLVGACDAWGGMECRRVWREYLDAGMPEDVAGFIRRRANILSDGSERGMV